MTLQNLHINKPGFISAPSEYNHQDKAERASIE